MLIFMHISKYKNYFADFFFFKFAFVRTLQQNFIDQFLHI
jgi:hypothetical protein